MQSETSQLSAKRHNTCGDWIWRVMIKQTTMYKNMLDTKRIIWWIKLSCLDSFHNETVTGHQESPLCTWLSHCRKYRSSRTLQTPAVCSGCPHFHAARASQHPLGRSSPDVSHYVLREAWSRAQEIALRSTFSFLRGNKRMACLI